MEFAGVDEGTEALEIDDSVQGDAIALPVRTEQKSEVSEETAESELVTE